MGTLVHFCATASACWAMKSSRSKARSRLEPGVAPASPEEVAAFVGEPLDEAVAEARREGERR